MTKLRRDCIMEKNTDFPIRNEALYQLNIKSIATCLLGGAKSFLQRCLGAFLFSSLDKKDIIELALPLKESFGAGVRGAHVTSEGSCIDVYRCLRLCHVKSRAN